jgi:glucose/arabinose dehydrogenase/mono/diheme cytochrome c family protein
MLSIRVSAAYLVAAGVTLAACSRSSSTDQVATTPAQQPCSDAGLTIPHGFCATVFADSVGHVRHMTVSPNGTLYVNTWSGRYYGNDQPHAGGFLVALRDTSGNGRAGQIVRFGDSVQSGGHGGTGIAIFKDALYAESNDKILRYALPAGTFAPTGAPDVIVDGLPLTGDHPMHPIAIDSSGSLYIDVATATNACQIKNRIALSPGHRPCTELETRGGIWRYDATRTGQHFSPHERFATGIRNADGVAVDSTGKTLYATQQGRDQLHENWPKLYTDLQSQNFPSEELLLVQKGHDYGWPECYYDSAQTKLVLAPEYGGNGGKAVGPCASKTEPIAWFPAHWAPNDLLLVSGSHVPAHYAGGVFIAFHGSWNRAPGPQGGYNVVFAPFTNGKPTGQYEIFADGFAGAHKDPGQAAHRPAGLALAPDGALYISDDQHGRIWRIVYREGAIASPEPGQVASANGAPTDTASPPEGTNPNAGANPAGTAAGSGAATAPVALSAAARQAGITPAMVALGDSIYHGHVGGGTCMGCHGSDAKGTPLAPDLTTSKWIWGDGSYQSIIHIIQQGVPAPKQYRGVMPPMGGAQLTPAQVRAVAGYVFAISHPS